MSRENWQYFAAAIITLAEVQALDHSFLPRLAARFWDFIAKFFAALSWSLGWEAMRARQRYYTALEMTV